ncbi:RNA recognition [Musa troglodytarum]|uniref:RNA recognition n=1 Tax=Musa troglodytarum TaxID=320322 RepID=A0A9E7GUV5_9LILI|nr:RNA recognition [Musa troglodytarum]
MGGLVSSRPLLIFFPFPLSVFSPLAGARPLDPSSLRFRNLPLPTATMSDDGERTCPLCAEEMDLTDQQLKPCKCGYEVRRGSSASLHFQVARFKEALGVGRAPELN